MIDLADESQRFTAACLGGVSCDETRDRVDASLKKAIPFGRKSRNGTFKGFARAGRVEL